MERSMRAIWPMRLAKWGYIVTSVLFCVLGVLFIVDPLASQRVLGRALGIGMIVFGAFKIAGYFSKDLYRLAFQYDLEFGILLAVLGSIILWKPNDVLDFIFIALGIAILADGLFKIRMALDARRFGIPSWGVILGLAAAAVAAGAALMLMPEEGGKVLAVCLGISLLVEGILNLWVALATVKIIRHQRPDVIEASYTVKGETS